MVLPEAMAAGLPIIASSCGAIPEVAGDAAQYFAPGDWRELAARLREGPLRRPLDTRVSYRSDALSSTRAVRRLSDWKPYDRAVA